MKHSRFEFRDFGRGRIVYSTKPDTSELEKNRLIEAAVKEALADNIPITLDAESVHSLESAPSKSTLSELEVNIEEIRSESYKNGYDDAKAHFEPLIQKIKDDEEIGLILKTRLEAICPTFDLKNKVFELAASSMLALSRKLNLAIPVDFEKIIMGEMMSILNKYYRSGEITIKINPERVDYCQNLLKINALPAIIAENLKFVPDGAVSKNDCLLSWNDTEVTYLQDQIVSDVENIVKNLKDSI
ncbi:MAG: hypothetical protein RLZZ59_761 [Pseudomonadota bacterium]|jgi:flagellar biosynthesis/type III secretory pathway protein FliH